MFLIRPISTVLNEEGKRRLGEVVRQLRGKQTQKEFARMLEVGQSTLSMWESGKVTPDLENLEKLASVWRKTPEEFVAYLYGRQILNGTLTNAIDAMSLKELLSLQILISHQLALKANIYMTHEHNSKKDNSQYSKDKTKENIDSQEYYELFYD